MTIPLTPEAVGASPTRPATGFNPYASSMGPVSGVSGTGNVCSAMYIKEQNLNYGYRRVPIGELNFAPSDISLTGVTLGGIVNHTALLVAATMTATAYVVSGECWNTSSFTSHQVFNLVTTSSVDGHSYGYPLPDSLHMGPAGSVGNPVSGTYYSRFPYEGDAAAQPSYGDYVFQAFNYAIIDLSGVATCQDFYTYPNQQPTHFWSGRHFFSLNTALGTDPVLCGGVRPLLERVGVKEGPYSTGTGGQDTVFDIRTITDHIGMKMRSGGWVDSYNNTLPATNYDERLHFWQ